MKYLEFRAKEVAWAAAFGALLLGVAYTVLLGPELRYYDEEEYLRLARGILEQGAYTLDGSTPTAFRPPGYPGFLALGMALGLGSEGLRILQFFLLAGSVLLLRALTERMAGRSAGALSAIMAVVYPIFIYAAGTLYPQTLSTTLFLLGLLLAAVPDKPPSILRSACAGLVFGLLILCVPTFAFTFGLVGAWLVLTHRRRAIRSCVVGLAVASFVVGVWQVRNYRTFREPVFVATNSGINLLLGNSENATADSGVNADVSKYLAASKDMSEIERDRFYRSSALRWVEDNPGDAVRLYIAKVLHYFSYRDQLATMSEASRFRELLMLLSYAPLLLLALTRVVLVRRFPTTPDERLLLALYFLNAFFMAIFFTRLRFRIPMDALLIGIASGFVAKVLGAHSRSAPRSHEG